MLKAFALAASLLIPSGVTINRGVLVDTLTEDLTRSAPSTGSEGEALDNVYAYRAVLCAPSGQTLSGAGQLNMWHYNSSTGWSRNTAEDLLVHTASVRCNTWLAKKVGPPTGRFILAPSGVTVSSGTQVTVRYEMEIR